MRYEALCWFLYGEATNDISLIQFQVELHFKTNGSVTDVYTGLKDACLCVYICVRMISICSCAYPCAILLRKTKL